MSYGWEIPTSPKNGGPGGARTHDSKLNRLMIYRLIYGTKNTYRINLYEYATFTGNTFNLLLFIVNDTQNERKPSLL